MKKNLLKCISYMIVLVFVVQWMVISASSVFAFDFYPVEDEHAVSTIASDREVPKQQKESEASESSADATPEEDDFNSTASVFSTTMGKYSLIMVGCSIILVATAGYYAANKKAE